MSKYPAVVYKGIALKLSYGAHVAELQATSVMWIDIISWLNTEQHLEGLKQDKLSCFVAVMGGAYVGQKFH